MALNPGTRLGSYQVTAPLGQGGMGEVYRATDTALGRSVAIKILPESFAFDSERLARFEREARTLASLNHPNIAQVYGYENVNGVRALIMELVEGPTLADRLAEGPIPTDEALAIARQIATALEVAHDAGIVHRDLKPANVKVRPDGTVKVLDFGLAKPVEPLGGTSTDLSPTITSPALVTGAGVLLGTAGYMSPEQARGKAVDKRADIWAFGAVLYEMLTGERPFSGETNLDVLAQVVHKEPDFQKVPSRLQPMLRRCLEKDPRKRLRDISGVELLLERSATVHPRQSKATLTASVAAAVLAAALAIVTWALWPQDRPDRLPARFAIEAPPESDFTFIFPGAAITPDGRMLAFTAQRRTDTILWLRPMDSEAAREIPGTESANFPFWSWDSKWLAFYSTAERRLKRVDPQGGGLQTLCEVPNFEGGAWGRSGILFSSGGLIHRVGADGGSSCTPITAASPSSDERHTWPHLLPDERTFLYIVRSSNPQVEGVYASTLDHPDERSKLLSTNSKALYAPPYDGHPAYLLWLRSSTLVAQQFDADGPALIGDPIRIAERIRIGGGAAQGTPANRAAFWVSDNGLLVYRTGTEVGRSLVWVGRDGKPLGTVLQEQRDGEFVAPLRTSPDGTRIAIERLVGDISDLYVWEIPRKVWRKLTMTPRRESFPVWSPNGRQIAFASDRDGSRQIYRINADSSGSEERLTDGPNPKQPLDWSHDGRHLIYAELHPQNQQDLWLLPLDGPNGRPGKPIPFLTSPAAETGARFSPDDRWIAYLSNVTDRQEIYIRAFPGGPASEWPLSSGGAGQINWPRLGSELIYRAPRLGGGASTMAQGIRILPDRVEGDTARPLFSNLFGGDLNSSEDGQRFLVFERPGEDTALGESNRLTVLVNWQSALK